MEESPRVLIAYHSVEGQAARVAERVAAVLRDEGLEVEQVAVGDAPSPAGFDGVVVGGSVHAGQHGRALTDYLRAHAEVLAARPTALFQVSLSAADERPEKAAEAQRYVAELLEATGFDPGIVAQLAGALAYTRYGFLKRRLMLRVAGRELGDVDTAHDHEYTDWEAVAAFARDVAAYVRSEPR